MRGQNSPEPAQTKSLAFEDGAIRIDAAIVTEGLGIVPPLLLERMASTSVCEHGIDADRGRYRLTFFSANRRFRLVVDRSGESSNGRQPILAT